MPSVSGFAIVERKTIGSSINFDIQPIVGGCRVQSISAPFGRLRPGAPFTSSTPSIAVAAVPTGTELLFIDAMEQAEAVVQKTFSSLSFLLFLLLLLLRHRQLYVLTRVVQPGVIYCQSASLSLSLLRRFVALFAARRGSYLGAAQLVSMAQSTPVTYIYIRTQ